jgi:hypothetical protein
MGLFPVYVLMAIEDVQYAALVLNPEPPSLVTNWTLIKRFVDRKLYLEY